MKVIHIPTDTEIREERKKQYLAKWPIEAQLEAISEAAMGRTGKREAMLADFAWIRESLPYLS